MAGNWPILSLRDAGIALIDCEHKTPPASNAGFPYIAIPQIRNGRLDLSDARRISPDHYIQWTRKAKPKVNDVVLSRRCNPGETAFIPPDLECALGQNLVLLRSDGSSVYPPFLRWLVRGPEWWRQIETHLNVGAVFDSLKCADVPTFHMTIPSFGEQRRIAGILGALDDKIELNRRMNETLEAMARAIFKSWFVDFDPVRAKLDGRQPAGLDAASAALFPVAFENSPIGQIPTGWHVGKIVDCTQTTANGGTPRRDIPSYWEPPIIPWLTSGEVRQPIIVSTENCISQEGFDNSSAKLWPSWTTVVALYGATAGYTCLIATELCANQACCGLVPHPDFRCFNYLALSSSFAFLVQQARGSAQQNLSKAIVEDCPVVVPPIPVAQAFDNLVSPWFEKWILNSRQSKGLAATRDALLPKLLSGEIRVRDAERAVEEVV